MMSLVEEIHRDTRKKHLYPDAQAETPLARICLCYHTAARPVISTAGDPTYASRSSVSILQGCCVVTKRVL